MKCEGFQFILGIESLVIYQLRDLGQNYFYFSFPIYKMGMYPNSTYFLRA